MVHWVFFNETIEKEKQIWIERMWENYESSSKKNLNQDRLGGEKGRKKKMKLDWENKNGGEWIKGRIIRRCLFDGKIQNKFVKRKERICICVVEGEVGIVLFAETMKMEAFTLMSSWCENW